MKKQRSKLFSAIGMIAFWMVFSFGGTASAHSTKGRIKVPLDQETIAIDDVAYFVESHVHRQLYDDRTPETRNRFFVNEFIKLNLQGPTAEVHFRVLDKKTNIQFNESLRLSRNTNGIWQYQPPDGAAPVELHTFVTRGAYYWSKYGTRIRIGTAILCCGLTALVIYLKRRPEPPAPWETGSVPPAGDSPGRPSYG